jgi:hypothetical protein
MLVEAAVRLASPAVDTVTLDLKPHLDPVRPRGGHFLRVPAYCSQRSPQLVSEC